MPRASRSSRRVFVDVHPTHLDVVTPAGEVRTVEVELPPEQGPWRDALQQAAPRMARLVDQLDIRGQRATVIYRSPTQGVGLESLAVSSRADAEEAALLGVTDQLSYASVLAASSSAVIGRDRGEQGVRTHIAATADHEDTLRAIADFVGNAGLRFDVAVPRDALLMTNTIADTGTTAADYRGHLRFGEWTSYLVVTGPNGLEFARRISIGVRTLVRGLVGAGSGDALDLTEDEARDILREHGIPDADAVVDAARNIRGRQVRARLQSVLQRLVIEVRQSLRFGLDESVRSDTPITLTGPGAKLTGLAEALAGELQLDIEPDQSSTLWPETGQPGSDLDFATRDPAMIATLGLMPRRVARERRTAKLSRFLWTGAAAALLVIALDAVRQHAILENVTREADVLRSTQAVHEALEATGRKLREAIDAMSTLEATLDAEVGSRADFDACLRELALLTPETIRLGRIEFDRRDGAVRGSLSGYAFDGAAAGEAPLPGLVAAMQASPLFDRVALGDVAAAQIAGRTAMRFDVDFIVVEVPREDLPGRRVASAEVSP